MKRTPLSIPEIAIIGGTRAALGAGAALLLADRLDESERRAIGWTLLGIGALTTIPIVVQIVRSRQQSEEDDSQLPRRRESAPAYGTAP